MKALITGSRDFADNVLARSVIEKLILMAGGPDKLIVVHGDARGADTVIKMKAHYAGVTDVRAYPAKWDVYGRTAGPKRNQEMLDKEHLPNDPIHICVAFPLPQSVGTYDMIRRAIKAGIPVWTPADGTAPPKVAL